MKLLHFSDVHVQLPDWRTRKLSALGPLRALATVELWRGRGRRYDGAADRVRAIVEAAMAMRADHVLLTGDLTQLGHAEEFALAREALGPLAGDAARFTTLAGNHDRYPLSVRASTLFEQHFPEQCGSDVPGALRVRFVGSEAALIVVDSAQAVSWPVVSGGVIQPATLHALAETLRSPALAGRCKLVLVHHAPTRRGDRRDWPLRDLRGATSLMRVAAEGGAAAILCGHIHDRFHDLPRPGRPHIICAGSSTDLDDPGYWELEFSNGRITSVIEHELT